MKQFTKLLVAAQIAIPSFLSAQPPDEPKSAQVDRGWEADIIDRPRSRLPDTQDVLDYALAHPRDVSIRQPDGATVRPKYGDPELEKAEAFLTPRYPRPWTVPKLFGWFEATNDGDTQACLLRVLAASRSPQAALLLGEALNSQFLPVRVAGTVGLCDYFLSDNTEGGLKQAGYSAKHWFAKYEGKLQKEAAAK